MSALRVEIPMIDSMGCKTVLAALMALTLSACASSQKPVNQEVALRVSEGGERVEASCEVSNDRASWSVVSPLVFGVTRSEKPLTVECRTAEGSKASRVFEATKEGNLPGTGFSSYAYPATLELALVRDDKPQAMQVNASPFASIDDVNKLPQIDEVGRDGYRRFLAGDSPRAFAISDKGRWVRVNAVRGAARLAMDRCQTYGGRCRLYAVDNQVVWDQKRASDLVASY